MNFMCVCEERIEIWVTGQEASLIVIVEKVGTF